MSRKKAIFICGGDYQHLENRSTCPNAVHDWPLPAGYSDASEVAGARLRNRWTNKRCPTCGLYGWIPSSSRSEATNPIQVTIKETP